MRATACAVCIRNALALIIENYSACTCNAHACIQPTHYEWHRLFHNDVVCLALHYVAPLPQGGLQGQAGDAKDARTVMVSKGVCKGNVGAGERGCKGTLHLNACTPDFPSGRGCPDARAGRRYEGRG